MSGGGGGGGTQTTTTTPWAPQQPYLTNVWSQADNIYRNNPTTPYEFDRTAPQSGATHAAQDYNLGFAQNIAPGMFDATNATLQRNLNAQDVDNNPYLAKAANAAINPLYENLTQRVLPQIGSEAIRAGAYGGGRQGVLEANAVRDTQRVAADSLANIYSNAYQNGVNTSLQATNQANQVANLGLMPGSIVGQVGAQRDSYNQQLVNDAMNRYYEQFQYPWQDLQNYAAAISGNVGATTTAPAPRGASDTSRALGGAAAGMSIGGPWGAAIGAGLGLLGG